jgi:hypothetical protein
MSSIGHLMVKNKKHPKDMTSEELAQHIFHPKAMEHIKKHIEKLHRPPTKKHSTG